jgi:hypothetical protein
VLPGFVAERPRDMTVGDIHVTGSNTYDVANSRLLSTYVFSRGAQEVRATALHHVFTLVQIRDLLRGAGFCDIRHCGGTLGEPFELGCGRLLLTATRL